MLYVSSACINGKKISEIVSKLAEEGIRAIELSGGSAYYDNVKEDLKYLKKYYKLTYACHAYFPPPEEDFVVNLASCNDEIYNKSLEHYDRCISLMKDVEIADLSVHAGFYIEVSANEIGKELSDTVKYDKSESRKRFCNGVRMLQKKTCEINARFYVENNVISKSNYERLNRCNNLMMTDYDSLQELKEILNFDFLLDLAHLKVSCNALGLNYNNQINKMKKYVKWIHISENNGIEDSHGLIDFNGEIYSSLKNIYDDCMNVTIESKGSVEEVAAVYRELERRLIQ